MPCADVKAALYKGEETINTSHPSEKKHHDTCTPFCICSCCAGFSINHFIAKISTPHVIQTTEYSSEISSSTFTLSLPIWQPPQL